MDFGNLKEAQEHDPDCSCIIHLMKNSRQISLGIRFFSVIRCPFFCGALTQASTSSRLSGNTIESTDRASVHWQVIDNSSET